MPSKLVLYPSSVTVSIIVVSSIIKVFPKYCNVTQQISELLSTIRFNFLCQGGATNLFIRLRVLFLFIQNTSPFLIGLSYPSQLILHNLQAPIK